MYSELGLVALMVGEVDGDRRLMTRLPSAEAGDSVHIFEGVAEDDPLRFNDLAIHALLPLLGPLGRAHAEAPAATDPEIHLADRAGEAVRAPPAHQMFRLAPGLEDDASRGVEDSGDDELGAGCCSVGAIFCHCSRPSSATRAGSLPGGRSSRPRSGDSGRANPQRP